MQEPVRAATNGDRGGATCLSPELAALIADAAVEHCTAGAPASRPASRALVCVTSDNEAHGVAAEGPMRHMRASRAVALPQHAAMAAHPHSMYGGAVDGGFVADAGARWSTASASTLGALPAAMPQYQPGASRVLQEIPRIKFPETKAGRQIQRLCGPDLRMLGILSAFVISAGSWMVCELHSVAQSRSVCWSLCAGWRSKGPDGGLSLAGV